MPKNTSGTENVILTTGEKDLKDIQDMNAYYSKHGYLKAFPSGDGTSIGRVPLESVSILMELSIYLKN
jgi:hypothetical protein